MAGVVCLGMVYIAIVKIRFTSNHGVPRYYWRKWKAMMDGIAKTIEHEVLSWPGTTVEPHRFGGIEFRVNHHEMGHLHGDRQADLPFPVRVRRELVAARRASLHHILPDTGWVTYYIRGHEDVPAVVELFRLNYERLTGKRPAGVIMGGASGPPDANPEALPVDKGGIL